MLLGCGDSLFDMFIGEANLSGNGSDDTRISVEGVVGGSPMNVALGMARFGHGSRYLTKLSNDPFGQRIARFLDNNNIDHSLSIPTNLYSTLAMVETQVDGSAQYAFYINNTADVSLSVDELPQELPADVRILHFASYSTAVEPVRSSLSALAARESAQRIVSYDPNLRLSIEPDVQQWQASFAEYSKHANIIKASDEDIAALFGTDGEDKFVAECLANGAELVYLTRGPDGASAFTADRSAHVPGVPVSVVDTVGAGDTFQATLLHWLVKEGHVGDGSTLNGAVDLQASIELAAKAAAITCSRRGADLPTLADLTG